MISLLINQIKDDIIYKNYADVGDQLPRITDESIDLYFKLIYESISISISISYDRISCLKNKWRMNGFEEMSSSTFKFNDNILVKYLNHVEHSIE